MRAIAWAVGHAVIIPVAVAIVVAEWLAFTWRRPLAGVLALVPIRKQEPIGAIGVAALTRSALCQIGLTETMDEALAGFAADLGMTADELNKCMRPIGVVDLVKAGASISETELGPMSLRMDFGMARPTLPVAAQSPALAPAPRKRRGATQRPQNPA